MHTLTFSVNRVLASILCLSWLLTPFLNTGGYFLLPDTLTSLNQNDSYMASYYFFWTNLTYLPSFFLTLLTMMMLLNLDSSPKPVPITFYFILSLPYTTELVDYLSLNVNDFITSYDSSGLNTLLTNTLNSYHPFIFYLGASFLMGVSLRPQLLNQLCLPFSSINMLTTFFKVALVCLMMSSCALWLGSWWALQEGTWGGWWNWDASETFGLLMPIALLSVMHASNPLLLTSLSQLKLVSYLYLLLASYFFMQLNFDLTSHNFGASFFFFFNNNLFFLETLTLLIFFMTTTLLLTFSLVTYDKATVSSVSSSKASLSYLTKLAIPSILMYWMFASYQPLLNYFLWNFVELNVFNYEPSFSEPNFTIVLIFTFWLTYMTPAKSLTLLILTLALVNNFFTPLMVALQGNFSRVSLLHYWIFTFTLLSWMVATTSFTTWVLCSQFDYDVTGSQLGTLGDNNYSIDGYSVETSATTFNASSVVDVNWNFMPESNSPAINYFRLVCSSLNLENYYTLGESYISSNLFLDLPLLTGLNLMFLVILVLTVSAYLTPLKSLFH